MPLTHAEVDRARAKHVALLSRLTEEDRELLLSRAKVKSFAPHATIVEEGDPGHSMFLLLAGEVDVRAHGPSRTSITLARLGPGAAFGEQALMPDGSGLRNASVVALGDPVRVLEIERDDFLDLLLHRDGGARAELHEAGARQLRERLALSLEGLGGIDVDAGVTERTFAPGERVFAQGDDGDAAYFVLAGFAVVTAATAGEERRVGRVGSGQCFGELAVLGGGRRGATVTAEGTLRALRVEASVFRDWYARDAELRDLVATLEQVQRVGDEGWLTVHRGTFRGSPCVTSVRHGADGSRVLATKVLGEQLFTITRAGVATGGSTVVFEDAPAGVRRELRIQDGLIVELVAEGPWPALGDTCRRVLEAEPVTAKELVCFTTLGDLEPDDAPQSVVHRQIVCPCLRLGRGAILDAIAAGNETAEAVAAATGAGNVCGACVPLLHELVGSSEHVAVRVDENVAVAPDIRRLKLAPVGSPLPVARPGQYVMVRGLLQEGWVERAYTLSDTRASDHWEILVKRESDGVFSRYLCDEATPGTLLRTSAPVGTFLLPTPQTDVVFFAAGVGVTPALAMIRSHVPRGEARSFHLHYSASSSTHHCAQSELVATRNATEAFSLTLHATREVGRLRAKDVAKIAQAAPRAHYLLCGPQAFMNEVRAGLNAAGIPPSKIAVEAFTPIGAPATAALVGPALAPPYAEPGLQSLPVIGKVIAALTTLGGPLEQSLRCRDEVGEVFTFALPGNPSTTYLMGEKGYAFFNALPADVAGIGEVLELVNLFGRWTPRSDMSPAHLEQLALGGKDFVQQLLSPERLAGMPAIAARMVDERIARWAGEIDLATESIAIVHDVCLRTVLGEASWRKLAPAVLPLLRRMASGVDVPRLPLGATPARFLMDDYWATQSMARALAEIVERHDAGDEVELVDQLRAAMVVAGGALDERDLVWALNYVVFNACAYPGTYAFWSLAHVIGEGDLATTMATAEVPVARELAEHALLETIRLHPVTVAGRALRKDIEYVDDSSDPPKAYRVPAGHLLASAPGSFTRDPKVHAEPDRFCPHRFARGEPVPSLFGGGAFGCVASSFVRAVLPVVIERIVRRYELRLVDVLPPKRARPALHYPHDRVRARVRRRAERPTAQGGE